MDEYGGPFVRWRDHEPPSPPHTGIRAFSEDLAWENDQNHCCVASNDLRTHGNTTDIASSPGRVSRYANMGLNRSHPSAPYRTPDTRSRDAAYTAEAVEAEKTQSVDMNDYLKTLDGEEDDDLAELAERIIPAELRSLAQQREESSSYGWQPINKTKSSRYTVWQLAFGGESNSKGWQLDDSISTANTSGEDISMAQISAAEKGQTPDQEGLVIDSLPAPVDGEETREKLEDADDFLWIDEKYFDHYGYLNFVNNVEDSKNGDETVLSPKGKKSAVQSKLKVPDKKGVQLGLDESLLTSPSPRKQLASPGQPIKMPAKVLIAEDIPMNDTDQPFRDTVKVHDEAKEEASLETSSDETSMWELLEGNIDAPRTGNVSPQKLTIKLRHVMTDERKTLTFTEVEHDEVDWKSKQQIAAIIKWRTEVFHKHGIGTKKNMMMYTPLEDAWMSLFHRKLRATIEAGHIIKLPGPSNVMVPFNAYFKSRELKDANGDNVGPRPARDATSIRGKLDGRASKIAKERKEMRAQLPSDNGGPMFIPNITEEELKKFQEDGTVAVEDLKEAGKNTSSGSEGKKIRKSSPKRKRGNEDAGKQNVKKVKKAGPKTRK